MTRISSSHRSCELRGATARFDAAPVLADVDLVVGPTDRLAVVGDNGAGKSTLLRMIVGLVPLSAGDRRVVLPGGIAFGEQQLVFDARTSVADACDAILSDIRQLENDIVSTAAELAADGRPELFERFAGLLDEFDARDGYLVDQRLEEGLAQLGLGSVDRARPVATLSGGERARLALAASLASNAELLLLDEPTNDLDTAGLEWLDARLSAHRGALVVVTHDRAFLNRFATDIVEVAHGRLRRYGDGYAGYLSALDTERRAAAERYRAWTEDCRRNRELVEANVSRLDAIPRKMGKAGFGHGAFRPRSRTHGATGRIRMAKERLSRLEADAPPRPVERLRFRGFDVSGAAARGPLITTPAFALTAGSRIVVKGPNGAGKTSLLRALAGELPGEVTRSDGVRIGWLRQQPRLPDRRSALDHFAAVTGRYRDDAVERLEDLGLLASGDLTRPIGDLSVGQRRRLELAIVADVPSDVLLLDEPTNHLAPDLVDQVQSAVDEYPGAVVTVTHDRRWLERSVADVIAV